MIKRSLLFCSLVFLFCLANNRSVQAATHKDSHNVTGQNEQYMPEELPEIVVAYNLYCGNYFQFKPLESNPQNPLIRLDKNMDAFPGGTSNVLVDIDQAFIVQNNVKDQNYGLSTTEFQAMWNSRINFSSALFVTTPIPTFGKRVLVIVGSLGPDRTTIFSVDSDLNVRLLYDTDARPYYKGVKKNGGLGWTYGIKVLEPGYYLIRERFMPGGHGFGAAYVLRTFVIDVRKGKFSLSQKSFRAYDVH